MRSKRPLTKHPEFDCYVVTLTRGKTCLVDNEDAEWVSRHNWHAAVGGLYAARATTTNRVHELLFLHRELLLKTDELPKGLEVDHINGDKLDNRRSNLRSCTHDQNCKNQKLPRDSKSGFRGVSWARCGKWSSQIVVNGVQIYLGRFKTPEEAHAAYEAAAVKHFGEFKRDPSAY